MQHVVQRDMPPIGVWVGNCIEVSQKDENEGTASLKRLMSFGLLFAQGVVWFTAMLTIETATLRAGIRRKSGFSATSCIGNTRCKDSFHKPT